MSFSRPRNCQNVYNYPSTRISSLRSRPCSRRDFLARRAVGSVAEELGELVEAPVENIKDAVASSLETIDQTVYTLLKAALPEMLPFTRTFLAVGIVCSIIVMLSQALAQVAGFFHEKLAQKDGKEGMENTQLGTTATFLKPLVVTLPIIGWLLALQRACSGLGTLFNVCTKQPAWFKNTPILNQLHHLVDWAAPLCPQIESCATVVALFSLTWTALLLKRRLFNTVILKMGVDVHGSEQAAMDMKRALLPVNTLASWLIVGISSFIGLNLVGLNPAPLLALGGVSGIVFGFASQQLLLNLIAGISIFLTRPFVVGDIIQVKNNHLLIASGSVANISPLRTTILDYDSNAVTLPNKLLSDMIIINVGDSSRIQERAVSKNTQQEMKQILTHDIALARPTHINTPAYDDYAKTVIKALLVRLSTLQNVEKNSTRVYVNGLSASGEIQLRVTGIGIVPSGVSPEATRQSFLLAIHNALCTVEAEEASSRCSEDDEALTKHAIEQGM